MYGRPGQDDVVRVLLIEDEILLAEQIADGLRDQGIAVDLAADGVDGLHKAGSNRYDVVVLDRDLPILHGDRLIGRIDPVMDRKHGVFTVKAVYAEPDAPADAWPTVSTAIHELAAWLGATEVRLPPVPAVWDR